MRDQQVPRLILDSGPFDQESAEMGQPSQAPAEHPTPQLDLGGDLLGEYLSAIRHVDEAWRGELRTLLRAIIREGQRFARTPEGLRWKAFLADSPLIRNGWLVWNISGLDFLLQSDDDSEFTPSELWQQITIQLAELDVEPYLTRLMKDLTYYAGQNGHSE